jgi:ribonuclease R
MAIDRNRILGTLTAMQGGLASVREILSRAGLNPGLQTPLKRLLRDLTREGLVVRQGKRFASTSSEGKGSKRNHGGPSGSSRRTPPTVRAEERGHRRTVIGSLRRHRDGYGFVAPLDGEGEDVFLPPGEGTEAMDGDIVKVEVVRGRGGRSAGRLIEVVEHRRRFVVGVYSKRGKASFVEPLDRTMGGPILVPVPRSVRDGQLVKVRLTHPPSAIEGARGVVVSVIGEPGSPAAASLEAAFRNGFSDEFPPNVLAEAEKVPSVVRAEEKRSRRDLTQLRLVTIDGEDARDFDDAVYVEPAPPGYRLVVAIADVAHYVKENNPLDEEATRRGTSVYLPDRVLPMLPEKLSNGICSLNPNEDRLCMVADLVFDRDANVVETEIYEAVMHSKARCTYTEIAAMMAGTRVPRLESLRSDVKLGGELAKKLTTMRMNRGAVDFDLPESKVEVDADGRPKAIVRRERNDAHRLVEEFMLAANEAVARYFAVRGLPTVYRVHDQPDPAKLAAFARLAAAYGLQFDAGARLNGRMLNDFLKQIAGRPEQRALNSLLLRSMMQALYSAENIGHFGLAATHYLHFTSPIRRYPDLMVHRLLKKHWARAGRALSPPEKEHDEQYLKDVSMRSSERERAAMEAERDVRGYFAALIMAEHLGERFQGIVSGVADFGIFVEITDPFVDGLVRADSLGDRYRLDEERHRLAYSDGRSYGIGEPVEVEVAGVNLERRQVDLTLVSAPGRAKAKAPASSPAGERPAPRSQKQRSNRGSRRA